MRAYLHRFVLQDKAEATSALSIPPDFETGPAEQWRLLRRQVASFGNPDLWAGLRRQLAPLRDTSVLEELRKHAAEPVPREHLEALRRDTEELDELADTLGDLGDPTQASDDLSWIESLPLATAARLFVKLLDYTVVLSTYLSTLGLIPPVLVPALTTLHRVLKALHDRLERENHDR